MLKSYETEMKPEYKQRLLSHYDRICNIIENMIKSSPSYDTNAPFIDTVDVADRDRYILNYNIDRTPVLTSRDPRPKLYFDRAECMEYLKTLGWSNLPEWGKSELEWDEAYYGQCSWYGEAICVNPRPYVITCKNGHITKHENIKRGYSDYLETLIHELVHSYFRDLKHGFEFEQKIAEIFNMIPESEIYGKISDYPPGYQPGTWYAPCHKCKCLVGFWPAVKLPNGGYGSPECKGCAYVEQGDIIC